MCDECTENAWVMSAEDEQQRIIKLLEDKLQEMTLPDGKVYIEFQVITDLIELIKGETNV